MEVKKLKNDYDTKYFEKFEQIEPFYPPLNKNNKRKDIQFIGFTYKEENDEEKDLHDEYQNAIQIIDDIRNINDDSFNKNNLNNNFNNNEESNFNNNVNNSNFNNGNEVMKKIKIEKNKYLGSRNNSPNSNKKKIIPSLKKDK